MSRPATVIGFSTANSSTTNSPTEQNSSCHSITQSTNNATANGVKFVFIPVSATVALDRIYKFVGERQLICEVRQAENGKGRHF